MRIVGKIEVSERAITTHRATYLIKPLSAISVRRPFLGGGLVLAMGFLGFVISFGDLLYWREIGFIAIFCGLAVMVGFRLAKLQFLSRDLRNNPLSEAIWGDYPELNRVRTVVARQIEQAHEEEGGK
jgi:hypothetical protein